jgi:transposase-like protein
MSERRKFTPEFKAQVVLDLLSSTRSSAELCRQHQLSPTLLAAWKAQFLQRAALVFTSEEQRSQESARIAELERLVGRLTLEAEIAKKALSLLSPVVPTPKSGNGRL